MNYFNSYNSISKNASPQLDSLRGLSALIVLFAHANQVLIAPYTIVFSGLAGLLSQSAVMVFFVLSGFLIGKSLTKNYCINNGLNIDSYLKDRFNRIYPPFLFSIVLVLFLYTLAPLMFPSGTNIFFEANNLARPSFNVTIPEVLRSALFLNGFLGDTISANGPLWSLSFEFWYYILAALLFKSSKPLYAISSILLLIVLSILSKSFLIHSSVWFLGLILCILHNNNLFNITLNKLFYSISIIGTLLFSLVFLFFHHNMDNPLQHQETIKDFSLLLFKLSVGLLTSCFVYSILREKITFTTMFKEASKYSYTLYIIHFPILLFIFGVLQLTIKNSPILLLLTYIVSCFIIIVFSKFSAKKVENIKILQPHSKIGLQKKEL
ncbi:acyltransferase family protein [Acinetobacter baumannii]|uniref:acyltransferase family protein n=1 Tax=Acinetobacter baumannii TaxID=470 RepID=UPI003CFCA8C8